jgi:hypothetical protein
MDDAGHCVWLLAPERVESSLEQLHDGLIILQGCRHGLEVACVGCGLDRLGHLDLLKVAEKSPKRRP